jgi:hypothetical protein
MRVSRRLEQALAVTNTVIAIARAIIRRVMVHLGEWTVPAPDSRKESTPRMMRNTRARSLR